MLHDRDIREPLFDFLEETYGRVRIIEEKSMGMSRADVVMVTETALYGIEIKSDADTYARLTRQVKDYDRYYDFNYAVVGASHGLHIEEHVPEYWGIITVELVDDNLDFYILRKPDNNPKVTWERKLEILWRPELALIQDMNSMPKYKDKSKLFVKNKIIERINSGKIDPAMLAEQVSQVLMERDYNNISESLREYREAEKAKLHEKERDPEQQAKLEAQRELARKNFKPKSRRRKRSRGKFSGI